MVIDIIKWSKIDNKELTSEMKKLTEEEIESVVRNEFNKPIEFTKLAEAEEYRQTLAIEKQHQTIL